jgi:hypothetical protein
MPRPGPRRPTVLLRMAQNGIDWIDQRAIDEGLIKPNGHPNRSEMIRLMLAYAQRHMPKGWRP